MAQMVDGIPIEFGHRDVRLRIRPNGGIGISDGRGRAHNLRVDRWPVLRGRDHTVLRMRRVQSRSEPTTHCPGTWTPTRSDLATPPRRLTIATGRSTS